MLFNCLLLSLNCENIVCFLKLQPVTGILSSGRGVEGAYELTWF